MTCIDLIYQCHLRPALTELVLDQAMRTLQPYDVRLILCYDGHDPAYIKRILGEHHPWRVVANYRKHKGHGLLLNEAFDQAGRGYIMFLENDFYMNRDCISEAVKALEESDWVMMHQFPFTLKEFDRVEEGVGWFRPGQMYKWNLHPSLQREQYLAGRFPDLGPASVEHIYIRVYHTAGKISTCLLRENFTHIGVTNALGAFKQTHLPHMGIHSEATLEDVHSRFREIAQRSEHVELYREYLKI